MRRIVGGLLAAALGVLVAAPASAAVRRDPSEQPFSVASVWNTPIGREARYVPAGLPASTVGVDLVTVATLSEGDPVEPVLSADCARAGRAGRMPASLDLPPAGTARTLAVVGPDRLTVDAWTSLRRCGESVGGRYAGRTRLDGEGVPAGASVAGLPGLGGALTAREARGAVPVRHALAVLVPARLLAAGPAWPAVRSDGTRAPARPGGTLRLGALLALPPAAADRLAPASRTGRQLVAALRDHGAYVAGVSGADTVRLRAVRPASLGAGVRDELGAAVAALAVVADNTPASVGGSGARRAPLAAPLAAPSRPAPAPTPTAGATAPPAAPAAVPAAPAAQIDRRDQAPPVAVAVITALALALLLTGLRAGRAATRPFS